MSKHLLLYTDDPGLGGVGQYNHSILCNLVALGYRVTCVQTRSSNPLVEQQSKLGIQHIWLEFDTVKDFGRTLTDPSDAQRILTSAKPDLVIFSDSCPVSNFAAKQVAIQFGIPYIVVVGFVAPYLAERFATYLNELSHHYAQAKAVIAVSTENLSLLHKLFRLQEDKGQVIYYGRPEQYFNPAALSVRERLRQEFAIPSDAIVCFTAARLEAVKGYQYQLEAIKRLNQSSIWPQLYFVWAGPGTLEPQLKEQVKQLGVANQVKILGQRWDIADWLDASDIFILPSELEGMPLAIMEAMAKGLPVIASAVSGIPEELGDTGKLLPSPAIEPQATVRELVTVIQDWSLSPELRYSVGWACKTRAVEIFREERMVEETVEVIEGALNLQDCFISGISSNQFINKGIAVQQAQEMIQQAVALLRNNQPAEAMQIAEKILLLGTNVPEIHYLRCICFSHLGRPQEALEAAKAELATNPTHRQAAVEVERLTRAICRPETTILTKQRTWNTALPCETMLSIERGSHNYAYRSVPMVKNPFDVALYPLLVWNLKPRTIIEIGSKDGGSALWLGDMLNNFSIDGHIYSVDIVKATSVNHPCVTFMEGNGRALQEIFTSSFLNSIPRPLLVIEDADHAYETSKRVLEFFHPHLREGEYIIIEDGMTASGPIEALREFLSAHESEYEIDGSYGDLFGYNVTWCINGYLKKTSVVSDDVEQLLCQIHNCTNQYQKDPTNQSTLANLRQARLKIANQWLGLPLDKLESAYISDLGKVHKILLNSGIEDEPLVDVEQNFADNLVVDFAKGFDEPRAIQYLLATMLYYRADQLPLPHDLTYIPNWFISDYLDFAFSPFKHFQKIGEADSYCQYMTQLVSWLHSNIFSNPDSKLWQDIVTYFTSKANFIPLYFNGVNLKDIYTKRADIIEFSLKNRGYQVDYEFPERSPEQKKICIGILAAHFGPQTETFATLPIYKHLNRDLFEITLFTLNTSNHRLGRYCVGHADTLVELPADLPSQVQTIREAELDILFISTNVTAVTHPITMLALHRLARIQMVDANSPVTTGMRHVDYYISSKLSESEDAQQHYTKTLVTLDSPPQCFDFGTEEQLLTTTSISREELGISKDAVVYISGANYYKIIPELEAAWARVIASVANSVLLLYPFNPNWSSSYPATAFRRRITRTFAEHGLSQDRLLILDAAPNRADVKERLQLGDVYLDSYPYSGMTSLIDPLELGLPTVVWEAEFSRSKKGASLLRELQIFDLIAENAEAYIELAIALGTNPELRKQKSDQIKQRMQANPRFLDTRAYSAQMGALFQELFQNQQAAALKDNLKLRDTNIVIFPDWGQLENRLLQDLANVIRVVVSHPNKDQMTLLIDTSDVSEEDANLALSTVVMNLLMEEDLDVTDGPEISLIGRLSEVQWQALLPHIKARIALENENQQAILYEMLPIGAGFPQDSSGGDRNYASI